MTVGTDDVALRPQRVLFSCGYFCLIDAFDYTERCNPMAHRC